MNDKMYKEWRWKWVVNWWKKCLENEAANSSKMRGKIGQKRVRKCTRNEDESQWWMRAKF